MQEDDYYNDYLEESKQENSKSKKRLWKIFKEDNFTQSEMQRFLKNQEVLSNRNHWKNLKILKWTKYDELDTWLNTVTTAEKFEDY